MYHRADFIQSDPVQFPHRYTLKQDIEVSGLLTAIMSFGNRKQILKKAEELHGLMGDSPYQYVLSRQWEGDFPPGATGSFYRMLSHADKVNLPLARAALPPSSISVCDCQNS